VRSGPAGRSRETLAVYTRVLHGVVLPFCRQSGITEARPARRPRAQRPLRGLLDGTRSRSGRSAQHAVGGELRPHYQRLSGVAHQAGRDRELPGPESQAAQAEWVDVLSREDIRALEDAAPTERDKLIVRILADTGVRPRELLTADPSARSLTRKWYLKVRGKGDKERMVPIQPRLANSDRSLRPAGTRRSRPVARSSWATGAA